MIQLLHSRGGSSRWLQTKIKAATQRGSTKGIGTSFAEHSAGMGAPQQELSLSSAPLNFAQILHQQARTQVFIMFSSKHATSAELNFAYVASKPELNKPNFTRTAWSE
jgi:hypothetical protein